MRVSSGSRFFLFWFALAILLLGGASLVYSGVWDALPSPAKLVVCILIGLLVGFYAICVVLVLRHARDRAVQSLDFIIVLGAQVREDGPSASLLYRLQSAYAYMKRPQNSSTICIVSGGQGANEHDAEAHVMAQWLIRAGVERTQILEEDTSTSTWENIALSCEKFNCACGSLGLVTNDFHLFRSLMIARKQGLAGVSGIAAPSTPLYFPNNVTREVFAIAKGLLKREI